MTFTADFARADGTRLGSLWPELAGGSQAVLFPKARLNTGATTDNAVMDAPMSATNYEESARVAGRAADPANTNMAVLLRAAAGHMNVHFVSCRSSMSIEGFTPCQSVKGKLTGIPGDATTTATVVKVLSVRKVGPTTMVLVDGLQVIRATETTLRPGKFGRRIFSGMAATARNDFRVNAL